MSPALLAATFAAGFLYIVTPGPAFLALFALSASEGRGAGARFVTGHLVGDVVWGALALAAIIGVSQVGAAVFEALGLACGLFLIWLGAKAIFGAGDATAEPIGKRRPLATGVAFGLTNPKAYPVSLAMFTALTAGFASDITWADAPALMAAAFCGFLAANVVMVFSAGLPAVRRFFARHGTLITRCVGVMFVLFGAKSVADAATSFARRS
ncbi:MAG: LysE family translocator [Rhizobiales bacterium]|nr:LysE family translocator [Hyphomicrobiales bacterium]